VAEWLSSMSPQTIAIYAAAATLAAALIAAVSSLTVAAVNGWFAARLARQNAHREFRRQRIAGAVATGWKVYLEFVRGAAPPERAKDWSTFFERMRPWVDARHSALQDFLATELTEPSISRTFTTFIEAVEIIQEVLLHLQRADLSTALSRDGDAVREAVLASLSTQGELHESVRETIEGASDWTIPPIEQVQRFCDIGMRALSSAASALDHAAEYYVYESKRAKELMNVYVHQAESEIRKLQGWEASHIVRRDREPSGGVPKIAFDG
jgi:hypothetical protein